MALNMKAYHLESDWSDWTDALSMECRWIMERVQPAEALAVISVTAELGNLHFARAGAAAFCAWGVKEGGEEVEGESRQRSKFTDKVPFGIPVLLHAWGERMCSRNSPRPLCLSVLTPAQAPTDHLIQTDDTDARKWHTNTTDYPPVQLKLAETNVLIKQLKELSTKADAPSTGCENNS